MANLPQPNFPSGTLEIDAILRQIAESAQALSGATGSAIAIRNGNDRNGEEVLCVARSGHTAPPLGSRLDANSGISGECLLTGRMLHCDDTASDHRVDPEVCRQLELRSIVVLPVWGRSRIAGVLEVFSTIPHAFTKEHLASLKRLAEMVEMACISKSGDGLAAVARQRPYTNATADSPVPATKPTQQPISSHAPLPSPLPFRNRRRYWIAGGVATMLLLVTFIGLNTFHSSGNSDAPKSVAQSQILPSSAVPVELLLPAPANTEKSTARERHNADEERRRLQKAAKVDVLSRAANPASSNSTPLKSTLPVQSHPPAPSPDLDSSPAPSLPLLAKGSVTPEVLIVPSVTLPKFAPAISQGVTRGVLDHKVNPIYPPQAISARLEGNVVLEATITKTGEVRDLKLLKGSPVLGRAAMDAVKQWHYQPSRLNGEPIELQTNITIQFHAQ